MSENTEINYLLTVNVEQASSEIRQLERLMFRTLSLFRRMGLPEEIGQAIDAIQRLISLLRMLRIAIALTEAASGPIGWALAAVSGATFVAEAAETVSPYSQQLYEWTRGKPP